MGLRVICPFVRGDEPGVVRGLHPLTERALAKYAPEAEMHYVGTKHDAYRDLLEEVWRDGESFVVVEQDIELTAEVIPAFEASPELWKCFAYVVGADENGFIESSLGCTCFDAALIAAVPDAISGLPVRDWRRIDCELSPRLRTAGFAPHVLGKVAHHHRYPAPTSSGYRCACGEQCDDRL